jgi:hypothetical protein
MFQEDFTMIEGECRSRQCINPPHSGGVLKYQIQIAKSKIDPAISFDSPSKKPEGSLRTAGRTKRAIENRKSTFFPDPERLLR